MFIVFNSASYSASPASIWNTENWKCTRAEVLFTEQLVPISMDISATLSDHYAVYVEITRNVETTLEGCPPTSSYHISDDDVNIISNLLENMGDMHDDDFDNISIDRIRNLQLHFQDTIETVSDEKEDLPNN